MTDDGNPLADFMREVIPDEHITRVLEGVLYPVENGQLGEGVLVDTDGRQVGPGCMDALVLRPGR